MKRVQGTSEGWRPCLHWGAGDLGVLFVKILQAVHLIVRAFFCMYVRILDKSLKTKICDG